MLCGRQEIRCRFNVPQVARPPCKRRLIQGEGWKSTHVNGDWREDVTFQHGSSPAKMLQKQGSLCLTQTLLKL